MDWPETLGDILKSLSSWRAWIEIDLIGHAPGVGNHVALLMESVD